MPRMLLPARVAGPQASAVLGGPPYHWRLVEKRPVERRPQVPGARAACLSENRAARSQWVVLLFRLPHRPPTVSLRARLPEPVRLPPAPAGVVQAFPQFLQVRFGTRGP